MLRLALKLLLVARADLSLLIAPNKTGLMGHARITKGEGLSHIARSLILSLVAKNSSLGMSQGIRSLVLLSLLLLGSLVACNTPPLEEGWKMLTISSDGLDSLHAAGQEVLIVEGRRKHAMELYLRHDNRTEQTSIPLVRVLRRDGRELHRDTLMVQLAERPGLWRGSELVSHEASTKVPQAVYIEYAGLYEFLFYVPKTCEVKGLVSLGFRLRSASK